MNHPLVKYGLAVVMANHANDLIDDKMPSDKAILTELKKGLMHFRLSPADDIQTNSLVSYKYVQQQKADGKNNIYLAPNIIVQDKPSGNTYSALEKIISAFKDKPDSITNVSMSIVPMAGDYLVFGATDARKGAGKMTHREAALSLISTTTLDKPCLSYKTLEKGKTNRNNVGIIPDLPLPELVQFVKLVRELRRYHVAGRPQLKAKVKVEKDKQGNEKNRYPMRPTIYDGNFPYAPPASTLSKIGLLASIAEVVKDSRFRKKNMDWPTIERMVKEFPNHTFYLFGYGKAESFRYDHFVVNLALESNLYTIVTGLYRTRLFQYPDRIDAKEEYNKFDLFLGRFLQLFNDSAFRDFFAFRGEYQPEATQLFNTYFMKKKNVDPVLVASAQALGAWINQQAYWLATKDTESSGTIYERKSKILATVESTVMSAPTGADLAVRAIRDISQHSKSDAPAESTAFVQAVIAGEIDKQTAKNLILAFSRISTRNAAAEIMIENLETTDEQATSLILDTED